MTATSHLEVPGATLAYDVHGPLPTDDRPPLLMIAQPMDASGFGTLASHFGDRTVVTYDPRGLGRSVRSDGRTDHDPEVQASDVHALTDALGAGPVEMFASSGGAVTALALVAAHPDDVAVLVAHEPPLIPVLPDADRAAAAERAVQDTYRQQGWGAGMAAFIGLTMWQGEFTDAYAGQPPPDPAQFGLATEDDGSRDDPLLSGVSNAVTAYRPDVAALKAAPTRIVIAVGTESRGTLTGRTSEAMAELLGQKATVFPSHHGGFLGGEFGQTGEPEAFAVRLRDVLDEASRIVSASREIQADAARVFELIADPNRQPEWDGNDNLAEAAAGQRVHRTGDVFTMTTSKGNVRENHVVEFTEGRLIAWRPAEPGGQPPGHLWRWELEPLGSDRTRVTHTYDWTELADEKRFRRARATTAERLRASVDRLAALVEQDF